MNKVISNEDIRSFIIQLIKESEKYLILISPYVKLKGGYIEKEIERSIKRGVKVRLLYRSDDLSNNNYSIDEETLYRLDKMGVVLRHIDDLHTKLYLSDKGSIMTSMNLYNHSSTTNEELGIYSTDQTIIKDLHIYCKNLFNNSNSDDQFSSKQENFLDEEEYWNDDFSNHYDKNLNHPKEMFCIRCSKKKNYEPDKPFCIDCFTKWKEYENPDYKEKYCGRCGKSYSTSFYKPFCKDCYYDYM